MRRQYFYWTYLVFATVLSVYGGYSVFHSLNKNQTIPPLGLAFFIIGVFLLILYFVLIVISFFQKKKVEEKKSSENIIETPTKKEDVIEESEVEEPEEEEMEEETIIPKESPSPSKYNSEVTYVSSRPSRSRSYDTVYVRKVGYGPVLRVTGNEILDMRSNEYYRIEGNMVYLNGSGLAFEIYGNKIRPAFGSYLYEISGSNINKVFGGFYASISGSYIQTYDLEEKYELSDSLNKTQLLVAVILLFGNY